MKTLFLLLLLASTNISIAQEYALDSGNNDSSTDGGEETNTTYAYNPDVMWATEEAEDAAQLEQQDIVYYQHLAHCEQANTAQLLDIGEGAAHAIDKCQAYGGLKRIVKTDQVINLEDQPNVAVSMASAIKTKNSEVGTYNDNPPLIADAIAVDYAASAD